MDAQMIDTRFQADMNTMSTCQLCGEKQQKLVRSHIIPKALYGDTLKDLTGPARLETDLPGHHPRKVPKGVYDQTILCETCEARFSPWDDHAVRVFARSNPEITHSSEDAPLAGEYLVDKEKLNLFFVSLLWRMHVTDHAMFKAVDLGKYETKARDAILGRDSSKLLEMDVVVTRFMNNEIEGVKVDAFLNPSRLRLDGVNGYRICFAEHVCWVKLDKRPMPNDFERVSLSKAPPLVVIYRDFKGSPEMRAMIDILRKNHS